MHKIITQFEFEPRKLSGETRGENPAFSQDFNRYSYVNNNPMRFTDPSGYNAIGCGHNPYWVTVAQQVAQGHAAWNDVLDYGNWRGLYAHSGFGGAQAYFYFGKSLLASGSVEGGLMGADLFTDAGIAFFEKNFGITPVNQGGVWGYFKNVSWSEGEQINYRNEQGYTESIMLQTFAFKNVFVPFEGGENGQTGTHNYSEIAKNASFGIGLSSTMYREATRGLTTTTSTVASEIQAAKILNNIAKTAKWTGYVGNFISVSSSTIAVYNEPTAQNYARAAVADFTVGLNLLNFAFPGLGTALSIGVGTADMAGGFDWFYNLFSNTP